MSKLTKNVTLKDLSKQLGVHVSTVSRVLNASTAEAESAASPDTIERIRSLATALNYQPNSIAKSLKSRKSQVIGVLVPKLSDVVLATIYEGIDAAATANHYFSFVSNTNDLQDNQKKLGEMALSRKVDGLIIADAYTGQGYRNDFLHQLNEQAIPFVLVSRQADDYSCVRCDDVMGGELAAQHLLAEGHRELAIIAGQPYASTGVLRRQGFESVCLKQGLILKSEHILQSGFDVQSGYHAGLQLLNSPQPPTAIFAVNDYLAIGVMGAVRAQGLVPGRDIAIVGFNDIDLAEQLPIPLTSIRSPMHEMGQLAVDMLIQKIQSKPVQSIYLKPTLMVRASSLDFQF